jgi:hypothetical protein
MEAQMMFGRLRHTLVFGAFALGAAGAFACSDRGEVTAPADHPGLARGGVQGPDLRAALAAKARYTNQLLKQDGVTGTAVGLGTSGNAVIKVYLLRPGAARVAKSLDGVPVETEVTGEIRAILPSVKPGTGGTDPTQRFDRPVPIGVSTGNLNDLNYLHAFCTVGTLGARLKGANGSYYALSNNHIFAVANLGQFGDPIIQPGQVDLGCRATTADQIGTLEAFVPLRFGANNSNIVDAAAALVSTATLDNETPSNGYGSPSSTTVAATLNMEVQKYGRATVLTHGTVTGIDGAFRVRYRGGVATFLHQVVVGGAGFSDSGDSGSLIGTDNRAANPVALLFAGSTSTTIGNPIDAVLSELGDELGTTLTIE